MAVELSEGALAKVESVCEQYDTQALWYWDAPGKRREQRGTSAKHCVHASGLGHTECLKFFGMTSTRGSDVEGCDASL